MPNAPRNETTRRNISGVPVAEKTLRRPDGNAEFTYSAFAIPLHPETEVFEKRQTPAQIRAMLTDAQLLPAPALSPAYRHIDRRFWRPAYRYLRPEDRLPTIDDLPDRERIIAKVRLFHPLSKLVYYVAAVTDYDGELIVTGYQIRPSEVSFGDSSIRELSSLYRPLPIERDLDFEGRLLSEIIAENNAR
jgi:hypothetical protein